MTERAPLIRTEGLHKHYGAVRALQGVSVDLFPGEIVSLVGANGAGKSTFIKILGGFVSPDEGTLTIDGETMSSYNVKGAQSAGVSVVYQELSLVPTASVAENILLSSLPSRSGFVRPRLMRARAREILAELGVEIDVARPAGACSAVQQRLVMVAAALSQDMRMLVLDEPTASLPPAEAKHILDAARRIRDSGRTVVFVSHRLDEVRAISDRVVVFRDGQVIDSLAGDEITVERMVEMIGGRRLAELDAQLQEAADEPARHDVLLTARGVSGSRVRAADLEVRRGEILGVAGLIGSGRSELLRLISGVQKPLSGELEFAANGSNSAGNGNHRRRVGYVSEHRAQDLFPDVDVAGNVSLPTLKRFVGRALLVSRRAERKGVSVVTDRVALKGGMRDQVSALSGGNKQKLLLARWLLSGVDLIVLDEPTVGIDVGARAEIHQLLRDTAWEGRAVAVTIAEPKELLSLCDRIVVLCEGRISLVAEKPFDEQQILAASYARNDGSDSAEPTPALAAG
jgi:ABC-type sugar transport system ATPase subunit